MRLTGKPCPVHTCGKKTLSHPPHAHAFGYKETGIVTCRSCKASFKTEKYEAWYFKKFGTLP